MQCSNCHYPLWNIEARTCPECGAAFKPSEHRFVVNSVKFCCPTCRQDYYGTGVDGHLVPKSFTCVRCQRALDEDDMILLPTAGVREEQTRVGEHPWLRRERGFVRALWGTIWRSLFTPARLAAAMPRDQHRTWQAVWYAVIVSVFGSVCVSLAMSVFLGLVVSTARPTPGAPPVPMAMMQQFGNLALMAPIVSLGAMMLWAVATHVCLLPARPASSLARTLETFAYAATPILLVPPPTCVGILLTAAALPWMIVSTILMLRVRQGVSGGAAAAAVLIPFGITAMLGIGLFVWVVTR